MPSEIAEDHPICTILVFETEITQTANHKSPKISLKYKSREIEHRIIVAEPGRGVGERVMERRWLKEQG